MGENIENRRAAPATYSSSCPKAQLHLIPKWPFNPFELLSDLAPIFTIY